MEGREGEGGEEGEGVGMREGGEGVGVREGGGGYRCSTEEV